MTAFGLAMLPLAGALAASITILTSRDPALQLGAVAFLGGDTLHLSVGIGIGAFQAPGDPRNLIYTVSDRGPNIKCRDSEEIVGILTKQICQGDESGRIFPVPDFVPSIFAVELSRNGTFKVARRIPLTTRDGNPTTGLPNPLETEKTEKGYNRDGKELPFDVNGLDTEGIVKLADGSFWLADEYGPSLIHVAAGGRIQERLVPAGLEADLAGAGYVITGSLPAILKKRTRNRGFESVVVSPDERFLYTILQSPLSHPSSATYKKSRQTRLLKLDLVARAVVGEFVYVLDTPDRFTQDEFQKQRDVKLSEMMALATDDLVVLERIDKTTRLQRISLSGATNILGGVWDDMTTTPSLEQLPARALSANGVTAVTKKLWLDSTDYEDLPAKIEGMTMTSDGKLALINDDDFGIDDARTEIVLLPAPARGSSQD